MAITRMIATTHAIRCLLFCLADTFIDTPPDYTKGLFIMIPYFLSLFLIFIGWAAFKRYQAQKKERESREAFWKKEEDANATRRQDISQLSYIEIPFDRLPFQAVSSPDILEQENILQTLSDKKILNLVGISNTDLKLTYGAANLPFLTECDEHFTTMCMALNRWGELLFEKEEFALARQVLEFSVASGSDIGSSYILLAKIYCSMNLEHQIPELIKQAEKINSLSKKTIILKLSEFVHN